MLTRVAGWYDARVKIRFRWRRYRSRVLAIGIFCTGIIAGLLLVRRIGPVSVPFWLTIALLSGCVAGLRWPFWWMLPLLMAAGLLLGAQRGGSALQGLDEVNSFHFRQVIVSGQVNDDPVYDDKRRLDFRLTNLEYDGRQIAGEIRVRAQGGSGLTRGDMVRVSGKAFPGFASYQATIPYAEVQLLGKSSQPLEKLRRYFFAGTYNALPEPHASLGLGFLVGLKSQLPDDLAEQLRTLALTHIVVASGYNLTILIRLARRLLARFSKFQALAGSLFLVAVMVGVTGMSPSMARAAVVTVLAMAAWFYGRTIHPVLLILLGAAITSWLDPLSLWFDLGWWLSFLAFVGVVLLAPLLSARFVKKEQPGLVAQIAIETISAQLLTTPLILFVFGEFSVLGIVANLLVVPFIPFAMLTTFVAGLAGLAWPMVAGWLAWPAAIVLGYIVEIVQLLAAIPWAFTHFTINAWGMAGLYALLFVFGGLLYRRLRFNYFRSASIVE